MKVSFVPVGELLVKMSSFCEMKGTKVSKTLNEIVSIGRPVERSLTPHTPFGNFNFFTAQGEFKDRSRKS